MQRWSATSCLILSSSARPFEDNRDALRLQSAPFSVRIEARIDRKASCCTFVRSIVLPVNILSTAQYNSRREQRTDVLGHVLPKRMWQKAQAGAQRHEVLTNWMTVTPTKEDAAILLMLNEKSEENRYTEVTKQNGRMRRLQAIPSKPWYPSIPDTPRVSYHSSSLL